MSFTDKMLFFFSALGAFNGIILGLYFIFFSNKKYLSNYLLGALLIVLSLRIGKSVLYFFDRSLLKIYLQVGSPPVSLSDPSCIFSYDLKQNRSGKCPPHGHGNFLAGCWSLQRWGSFILIKVSLLIGANISFHSFTCNGVFMLPSPL